jgi:hypothetical protein
MLIKLRAPAGPARTEVLQLAEIFRARVVDVSERGLTLCVSGDPGKVRCFGLPTHGVLTPMAIHWRRSRQGRCEWAAGRNTTPTTEVLSNYGLMEVPSPRGTLATSLHASCSYCYFHVIQVGT